MAKSAAKAGKGQPQKLGFFRRITKYFKEVGAELKKVTWPTRQELVKYTGVVLVFIMVFAVVIGAMDLGLTSLLKWIIG